MFKIISAAVSTLFLLAFIGIIVAAMIIGKCMSELPDYQQLAKYEPAVTTRLFAGDGQLLKEYAIEKRLFVPVNKIPNRVKDAFISAEDKKFYTHGGIDYVGILRAIIGNIKNLGTGRRPAGASTITQQVAKNFLLSSEVSYIRKIKEAILAGRMEDAFTKDHILELYLNEIYLGNRSYGVAAAALNYFDKALDELSIEEAAYLAALPKGPSNYNPKTKYDAAIARRNWVISRMKDDGYITEEEAKEASAKPLVVVNRGNEFVKDGDYFSEEVRREISKKFGDDMLYEGGLIVRTTLNPHLQEVATKVFKKGLRDYDIKHGYRGALASIDNPEEYAAELKKIAKPVGAEKSWQLAVVTDANTQKADILTDAGESGNIPLGNLKWARKNLPNQRVGDAPTRAKDVLKKGDVILVEKDAKKDDSSYFLRQVPNVEGAMMAIDAHTGKVLAVVGGYSYERSQFNRATQALRQTGSTFKPFVYLTALEMGYSPTDLVLDAPFVFDQGKGLPKWKPENYSKKFGGPMTLRQGIEKSRNLMTVRLAQDIGMKNVADLSRRIGVNKHLPELLSMSLGAGDTKLVDITNAYAQIVNGGKKIEPYFIERIQDRNGKTVFKHTNTECVNCAAQSWDNQDIPILHDTREQIVDEQSAYQMTYILEGVAIRGTGARLASLHKHLAGKTGTTNDNKDGWFIGFTPDLVVGVYLGFDEPRTLGKYDTGANTALPIFYDFMAEVLNGQPDIPFRTPNGIKFVRINYDTGKPAGIYDTKVIFEAIKSGVSLEKGAKSIIGADKNLPKDEEKESTGELKTTPVPLYRSEEGEFQFGAEY